jgi:hypothetical protein
LFESAKNSHPVKKDGPWTTIEDYYLLEGMQLYGKKWNKVQEHGNH